MRLALAIAFALCLIALPQRVPAQPAADPVPAAPVVDNPAQLAEQLTAQINQLRQQATDAPPEQIDDDTRKQILDFCTRGAEQLTKAKQYLDQTQQLKQEVSAATSDQPPQAAPTAAPAESLASLPLTELLAKQAEADQQAATARDKEAGIAAEIESRGKQRMQLPDRIVAARDQLAKAQQAMDADVGDDPPLLAEAKRLFQQARLLSTRQEVQLLEQQDRTFEATARWKSAQRDQAAAEAQAAEARLTEIKRLASAKQQQEANQQARAAAEEADHAAANSHPVVERLAKTNAELAQRNAALVQTKDNIEHSLARAKEQSLEAQQRLDDVTDQAEKLKGQPNIGAILRAAQDGLPDLTAIRSGQRNRMQRISDLRSEKYEWTAESVQLTRLDEAVNRIVREYDQATVDAEAPKEPITAEVVDQIRQALEKRKPILDELIANAGTNLTQLQNLNTEKSLVAQRTETLADFITERVFWVPSAPRLAWRDLAYTKDFWTNLTQRWQDLKALGARLVDDAKQRPELWLFAMLTVCALLAWRRKAKRVMYDAGELAAKPFATSFRPTLVALLATLLLAAPTPLLIGFVGWRLAASTELLALATGGALLLLASQYGVLDVLRHACRPGGLGPQHFQWDQKGLVSVRRAARPLQLIALPLLAIAIGVEITRDESAINSLGRISLICSLIVMGVIAMLFFRSNGPLVSAISAAGQHPWLARVVRALGPVLVGATLALAVASGLGMHYTAIQLTRRILLSIGLIAACIGVRALLLRWLLLAYRRVAMQRARERRKAMLEAQENSPTENAAIEVEPEVSLSDINQQARNLVGTGVAASILGSLMLVWGDVLPALNVLQDVGLWRSGVADNDGAYPWVTLASVLLSIGVFTLTWFAGRNVPGLLEIALFQKLPLDAGARYAATTVSRYLIVVVGVVIGMRFLGIGWQSVQWLVAAMTVGLGFGLQEIFANFVSGIILLFERPVRPGDVVTIGNVSGVVTRIRIRATTVQDRDNKELIVPNREFITGNLINWTLSSRMLRHVLKVGVAYGSNTRLAIDLLYKIARENPDVAGTPEPFVLFDSFGDSTLNLELRVFTQDLANMMRMRNALMIAVDEEFRANGIEIAFPQRDLHIRSLPAELAKLAEPSQRGKPSEHRRLDEAHADSPYEFSRDRSQRAG